MSDESREVSTWAQVDTSDALAGRNGRAVARRRWPDALKRRIVAETREPGASVSVVARRHDVNANQVFKWRRQFEVGSPEDDTGLAPVSERPSSRSFCCADVLC